MSVKETLEELLQLEANKLLKLAKDATAPLDDKHLERIALLARCAKAVSVQTSAQSDDEPKEPGTEPVADLLKAAE